MAVCRHLKNALVRVSLVSSILVVSACSDDEGPLEDSSSNENDVGVFSDTPQHSSDTGSDDDFGEPSKPDMEFSNVSLSSADGGLFTVNGLERVNVALNASVALRWVSRGAWECIGTDPLGTAWSTGVKPPSGQQDVSLQGFPEGQYTFEIECRNGSTSASRTVVIEIDDAVVAPGACEDRRPPSHLTRASECVFPVGSPPDPNCFVYSAVFGGAFPGSNNGRQFYQNPGEYVAFEFNTGPIPDGQTGQWGVNEPQFGVSATGGKIWSITKCPGDFDLTAIGEDPELGPGCYDRPFVSNASISWGGQDFLGSSNRCGLKPNQTYFLNIVYTSSPSGTDPDDLVQGCSGAGDQICGNLLTPAFTN